MGGGVAGVATAWLLDGVFDVTLFEARPALGGHARSAAVEVDGVAYGVDLGAQFFGPGVHPTFVRWLSLFDDTSPAITREMGTTIWVDGAPRPSFVSPSVNGRRWAFVSPWNLPGQLAFAAFVAGAAALERRGDWSITLEDWLGRLPGLTATGREEILLPWLSAQTGCSIDAARGLSARAAVAPSGRGLPANPLAPYRWSNARDGLGAVIEAFGRRCRSLTAHRSDAVTGLSRADGGGWRLHSAQGRICGVDHVVFATPPAAASAILREVPGAEALVDALSGFKTFPTRIVIHRDPAWVHPEPRYWSAYNATRRGGWCEASVWYGAMRDPLPDGRRASLFKSWATAREEPARARLAEADFRHLLPVPAHFLAQERVAALQGAHGLRFVGSWTRDVDLQETALTSAIAAASALAPEAPNLARLVQARAA